MKLKVKPEDFRVEEIIDVPELNPDGEYTYFWLTKKNWTTVRALMQIAKRCHTGKKRFSFAGNKDKVAITKQLCCAWRVEPATLNAVNLADLKIEVIGKGNDKINLGHLKGNRFIIIVKDAKEKIESLKARAELIEKQGFPNYFDDQRFGADQNSYIVGRHLLKGELEDAVKEILQIKKVGNWSELINNYPKHAGIEKAILNHLIMFPKDYAGALRTVHKKIRQIYLHAYQSRLYNQALSELIKSKETINIIDQELKIPDYKAKFYLPETLVLPGTETKLGSSKYDKRMKQLLKKDGIELSDFSCKRMPELASEGFERNAILKPKNIEIKKDGKDFIISFELGKGAYATLFLKVLFA